MKIRHYVIIFALLLICGAAIGLYLYTKPSPKAVNMKADFILKAEDLTSAYQVNSGKADKEYSGKVLQVSGKLAEIKTDSKGLVTLILEGSPGTTVSCILEKPLNQTVAIGELIWLKGFCAGWDDLFSEAKLHSGSIVNK
jgi:tRNA_anti-like